LIGRGPSFHSQLRVCMEWFGLSKAIVDLLSKHFSGPVHLQAAFDDAREAEELITQLVGGSIEQDEITRMANHLAVWSTVNKARFKRSRREVVQRCLENSQVKQAPQVDVQEVYKQLCQGQISLVKSKHKSTLSNLLSEEIDPQHREDLEERERNHWVGVLAQFIIDGELPIVKTINSTANPGDAWRSLFGRRRAKTLRNRARAFKRLCDWLYHSKGYSHPQSVSDVIDYMEQLAGVDAGKTVIDSLAASLALIETLGGVADNDMFSKNKLFQEACKFWKVRMGLNHTAVKKAEIFFVSMIISLELRVTEVQVPDFQRAMAWLLLVMHWGCMRLDDVVGIDVTRLSLTDVALKGILVRTKTSGPGRPVTELPFFVSRKATLAGVDWVRMGYLIWKSDAWSYRRDHFPLCPNKQQDGPISKPMTPPLMQSFFLGLLAHLKRPVRPTVLAGWTEAPDEDDYLIPSELVFFWTGHSARHWLPSVATAMGFGKDMVDFVGRWGAAQHQSRDYVVTARQVVLQIQEGVVEGLCTGSRQHDELDLAWSFKNWASNRMALTDDQFKLDCLLKSSATGNYCLMQDFPNFTPLSHYGPELDAAPLPLSVQESEPAETKSQSSSSKPLESPFWVSITGRTKFRRLHKRNSIHCGIMPWNCREVIDIWELNDTVADAVCKACQKSMKEPSDEAGEEASSSSGSSSSESRQVDTFERSGDAEPTLQPLVNTTGSSWSFAGGSGAEEIETIE